VMGIRVESAGPAAVILSLGAGILYVAQSAFWAVTTDLAGEASGTVSGFMNMGAQAGGAATASLTPWIARQWGWGASFIVAAALAMVGAGLWLTVNPQREKGALDEV
jgi:MFS transporter, ACS family, glucarate transporter